MSGRNRPLVRFDLSQSLDAREICPFDRRE